MGHDHLTEPAAASAQRHESQLFSPDHARPAAGLHPILQWQRTLGNRRVTELIQAKRLTSQGTLPRFSLLQRQGTDPWTNFKRQALGGNYQEPVTSGPTSKLPEPESQEPGYTEAAHPASYRVRVVAHASPRWRSAAKAKEADHFNLELSERRARSVGQQVESLLAKHLPQGSTTIIDASADLKEDTVGVTEEAHGSRDTLQEAHGDRKDNAKERRRVDVYISSNQDVQGEASVSKEPSLRSTASKFWHVGVNVSAGGGEGVGVGFLAVALTNDATGETMNGHVTGVSEGGSGPFPVSTSISFSDATGFSTKQPMNFEDFQNATVVYTNAGINLFVGYSFSTITFPLKGTDPKLINVSGANAGVPGFDVSVMEGLFRFDSSSFSPTMVPIEGTEEAVQPYLRTEKGEAAWTVLLDTGSDKINEVEQATLDSFLSSVVAMQR